MRFHLLAAVIAVSLGYLLGLSALEMVVLTIGLVVVAEMLNTAVEKIVDLICPQVHPLAKAAKDTAAGAVLAAAIIALAVAYFLFIRRFF